MEEQLVDRKKAKKEIHAVIEQLGDQIPPKMAPIVEEAVSKILLDQILPKDALGFSPEVMELLYQQGYNLFKSGKYQDALMIFNMLRQLDMSDTRFTFAIAACYHNSHQYVEAAANYLIDKYMEPFNPIPCFHLYDCFMKTNHPETALFTLHEALVLAGRDSKYSALKEKILLEIEYLTNLLYKKDKTEAKT